MILLLLLFALAVSSATTASIKNSSLEYVREWQESGNSTERLWISQIMSKVLPTFIPWSSTNEECTKHGILYKNHLANLTLWAVQMLDSSALSEIGLLSGNEYNFGNYDQCVQLNVPEYNIQGKNCMANIKFAPAYYNINEPHGISTYQHLSPLGTVWNKIKKVSDNRIKKRDIFRWAICIPSTCSHIDLQESLSEALKPVFKENGITIDLSVEESDCNEWHSDWDLTSGSCIFLLVFGAVLCIVLFATIMHCTYYESYTEEKEDTNILLVFSIISNTQQLIKPDTKSEFQFISGMKVLSMFLIIYGHRMLMSMYWPLYNVEDHEKMFETFLEIVNLNGSIIVNTFLLTTGFLIFNKLLRDIKNGRSINVPLYIFYRWSRSTPIYAFVLCLLIFIKPIFNNQPLFKSEALWRIESCTQNFWSYIFYVNNYYNPNKECILPAWYLAVDMQLYIVCVLAGYIFSKSRKCGYALLAILLIAANVIPGVITYVQGLDATLRLYLNFIDNYYENDDYIDSYIPTHMRAGPYVVGMVSAVILMKLQKKNYKFTMFQRSIGLTIAIILGIGSLLYAYNFYIPDRQTSLIENGLYVSIHRLSWSLCISWIILVGAVNGYGKYSIFLGSSIYTPLNKLTLCALLVHTLLQAETFLELRQAEYVTFYVIVWKSWGDIVLTYIASYFLYVTIESPIARLQNLGLQRLSQSKK